MSDDGERSREDYLGRVAELTRAGTSQRKLAAVLGRSRTTIRKDQAEALQRFPAGVEGGRSANPRNVHDGPAKARPIRHLRAVPAPGSAPVRLAAGRRTMGDEAVKLGAIMPPGDEWRIEDVDPEALRDMAPAELLARLVRVSPEVGRAYSDFLRMANSGYDIVAHKPGEVDAPDERAQEAVDVFRRRLADRNGTEDAVYNRLFAGIWLRGAFFAELVLASDARTPIDIATPDPFSARFRAADDPETGGRRWELVQKKGRDWVSVEAPTVKYVPVDPLPESPYGVAPVAPALFPALFLLTMLQDARAVIGQAGYSRIDLEVDEQRLIALMELEDRDDPALVQEWIDAAVGEITAAYDAQNPTSAYVHTSVVKVNVSEGTGGSVSGLEPVVEVLERQNVRALKTVPMLFGITDGAGEANANRQWEIHAAWILAMQRLASEPLSDLYTLALQAQGIQAEVTVTFHELRSIEEHREAETAKLLLENAEARMRLRMESHAAATQYATGHDAPDPAELVAERDEWSDAGMPLPTYGGAAPATAPEDAPEEDDEEAPEDALTGETGGGDEGTEAADRGARYLTLGLPQEAVGTVGGVVVVDEWRPSTVLRVADPITPKGGEAELPPLPASEPVTPADVTRAAADWDARVPEAAGLLDAEPVNDDGA